MLVVYRCVSCVGVVGLGRVGVARADSLIGGRVGIAEQVEAIQVDAAENRRRNTEGGRYQARCENRGGGTEAWPGALRSRRAGKGALGRRGGGRTGQRPSICPRERGGGGKESEGEGRRRCTGQPGRGGGVRRERGRRRVFVGGEAGGGKQESKAEEKRSDRGRGIKKRVAQQRQNGRSKATGRASQLLIGF